MTPQVFVSRPAVLSREQKSSCHNWLRALTVLGFEAIALDRAAYDPVPWEQLRHTIRSADGALILGFRQLKVIDGQWRPETDEAAPPAHWWATPWNEVEAGLAIMATIPVLVAAEEGIEEGVFSSDVWGSDVYGFSLGAELEPTPPPVAAWAEAVRARALALGSPH